jgi:L-alanine-DL-glutamate epimerase-like enolase superfamily enzyme
MAENFQKIITVTQTASKFEREKLLKPFGFKGGYLTELWQIASELRTQPGNTAIGLATQSVLYGDADLFANNPEDDGNQLMYAVTNKALDLVKQTPFTNPIELLDNILPRLAAEARIITQKPDLHINFIHNALVSVDNAAWLLYAAENGFKNFEEMIPGPYKKALGHQNKKIALVWLISYGAVIEEILQAVKQGYFILKIKTGHPGTQEQMLQADMERLTQVHNVLKDIRTTQTPSGKLLYTMDANGRYENKETLLRYLDHAKAIGAWEHILLYEEPLSENNNEYVGDIGIRMAADESVYGEASAIRRMSQGYSVMVLKGIAKTLSLSMKIAALAAEWGIPCICSDLTVNPILVEWHRNLAAGLAPFPGLQMGVMETNGDANYVNWDKMVKYHPEAGAGWMQIKDGAFELGREFYQQSGGIFKSSEHYLALFK